MRLDVNKLSSAVRLALSLGAVAAAGTTTAIAQDAAGDKGQALDTIVVTGSNIRRVDIETSNPVVTIDRAAIQQSGKLTLGDLLQNLPAVTGGNTNPQVNNGGGGGSSSIGLRGLGAQRTLVLVNGQRIIANGPGGADPNSIPANMIERIEVLTDGASSVYGSDAIAGVVNLILRSNYQGAEFSTDYGISDHDDGERKGYHFVFGQSSDKGSIMGGIDYNRQEQILGGNRKFGKAAIDLTNTGPAGGVYTFVGGSSNPEPGRVTLPTSLQSIFGCKIVAINSGANGQTVDKNNYHCFTNADKYNYAPINFVLTPQERSSAFVNGTYHLTDNVDVYLDTWHNKTSASFQLAPAIISTAGGLDISANSYYNPFGAEFARTALDYRLRATAAGPRAAHNSTVTDQLHTGFKGNFTIFDQAWNWDAGFGYGHFSVNTITTGLPNFTTLNADLGPSHVDSTGNVVCDSGAPGCTPFNIFALNQGNAGAAAAIAKAAVPAISQNYAQEKYEHLDVSGGLFNLPAGTVQLAGGVSHRTEYTHSYIDPLLTIDPTTGNCTLGSQCSSPLQGGYSVKEIYAEAFFPIFKDMPFVKALNVTLGDRFSKYSDFGSTNNWKAALEYRPIDDLLLRATVSKIFRAPTIGNIFGSPVSSAPSLNHDPCDFAGTGPNPNASNPACRGVPANGPFQNVDVAQGTQINALASGAKYANFPLGPEFGKSFDWGFVYDPSWVPGLSVSVDIWRLYLLNTIQTVGASEVIDLCFNGATQYCNLISRNTVPGASQGQILQLTQPVANLGRSDVQGADFGFKYRLPQFSFGQFSVVANATYTKQYDVDPAPGLQGDVVYHLAGHVIPFNSPALGSCPGNTGVCTIPRWKAQTAINWSLGPWDASLRTRYIGKFRMGNPDVAQAQTPVGGLPAFFIDYGATVYNDISAGYNIEPLNTRVDLGVDNVANKQPPQLYYDVTTLNLGTDPSVFDTVGRFYWARVTVKF